MRRELVKPPAGTRLARLAARQHGVVSRVQLRALGLSESAIDRRIRGGMLHPVHRGVYAVGHPRLTTHGRYMAAVLACGRTAVVSHFSAAVLWKLASERGPRIDITVATPGGRRRRGALVIHRSALSSADRTVVDGIPVTTPARTLSDLADACDRRALERALDEADYLRPDLTGLVPIQGRRGSGRLKRLLAEHRAGSTRTRSDLEETMLALARRFHFSAPEVNVAVEGHLSDFVWADRRLIVETDGWGAHGTRQAFERDRRRDVERTVAGWRVVRITWRRFENEPDMVGEQLSRLLSRS